MAREMLVAKIEKERAARAASERARIEKNRRQKRPRSYSSKQKMLADKSHQAEKKAARRSQKGDWS
jgi:hypothetical protein